MGTIVVSLQTVMRGAGGVAAVAGGSVIASEMLSDSSDRSGTKIGVGAALVAGGAALAGASFLKSSVRNLPEAKALAGSLTDAQKLTERVRETLDWGSDDLAKVSSDITAGVDALKAAAPGKGKGAIKNAERAALRYESAGKTAAEAEAGDGIESLFMLPFIRHDATKGSAYAGKALRSLT